jgi:hypothetical protein
MKKPSRGIQFRLVILTAVITFFSGYLVYGVERSSEFVDWPITESSGNRTPELQKMSDDSSIQFQVRPGFHGGILGSFAGTSKKYKCQSPFDPKCVESRKQLSKAESWKSMNQMPICTSPLQTISCIERIELA